MNDTWMIVLGGVTGLVAGLVVYRFLYTNEELGIYQSPDREAVYIDQSSCTVNYSSDQLVMYQRMRWCYEEYTRHQQGL